MGKQPENNVGEDQEMISVANLPLLYLDQFHYRYNVPVLHSPGVPTGDRVKARFSLMQKALAAFMGATGERDTEAALLALCELQYAVSGTIFEFGMHQIFDEAFTRVHEANMNKAYKEETVKIATEAYYEDLGVEVVTVDSGEFFKTFRKSDGELLAPVFWQAPELKSLLENGEDKNS
jgi:hypothetical protein